MLSTQATRSQYLTQQRIQKELLAELRKIWRRMGGDWDASFRRLTPDLVSAVSLAQLDMATHSVDFTRKFLDQVDLPDKPVAEIEPSAFIGYTSSGYPTENLMYGSVLASRTAALEQGLNAPQSLKVGGSWLAGVASSQIADIGRAVTGVGIAARPGLQGYTRFLNPPSCQRCAVLAGRTYRYSTGFRRHPQCFPEGVIASGPALKGATRRWYEGELTILTTASGQELPLTGNHPVLTSRGWVAANLIREGDEVVRSTLAEGAQALVVPDHDQVPACVEDVWRAMSVSGLNAVESSPEDFHGDGQHGEVDIVGADGALDHGLDIPFAQHLAKSGLAVTARPSLTFDRQRASELLDLGYAAIPNSLVRLGGLDLALLLGEASISDGASLAHASPLDAGLFQYATNRTSGHSVLAGQRVFTGPRSVGNRDLLGVNLDTRSRWDAPTLPDPVEQRAGYAALGLDLLDRLAGQVELDRVVFSRSVGFSGHVYSLASSEGWHSANSLIVSNCDCLMVPASSDAWARSEGFVADPTENLDNIKDLTKAQRRAIEDGADISQVVNARRGMSTMLGDGAKAAQKRLYGTELKFTDSGTTRRGVYGRAEIDRVGGGVVTRLNRSQGFIKNQSVTRAKAARPTPESIYRIAKDREDAIRLLKRFAYIF